MLSTTNLILRLIAGTLLFVFNNILLGIGLVLWYRHNNVKIRKELRRKSPSSKKVVIGFFHPHCSGGGGGERVLWKMVEELANLIEVGFSGQVVIYTIDEPQEDYAQVVLQKVKERFDIAPSKSLKLDFVHLHEFAHWLQPSSRFSLMVESYRTMRLAAAAFEWHKTYTTTNNECLPFPDWFIDTTGCAFTFVVARLLYGCRVLAYVHYPTISTDMLQMVWERRRSAYNHDSAIAKSGIMTGFKLVYYVLFAVLYGMVGSLAEVVLVNSSWTCAHIRSLWKYASWTNRIRIVYPPCRIQTETDDSTDTPREPVILSIGQFRPEKDHVLQIESFRRLLARYPQYKGTVKLVLLGGCRNSKDEERLKHLCHMTEDLDLAADVEFVVNQPYDVLQRWLRRASVGIHTMWNEHFGIGIVEMMDAGVIVVAHNSGGPKMDIVVDGKTGFLASTVEEYAYALHKALSSDDGARIRQKAKESSERFSDQQFSKTFQNVVLGAKLLQPNV